MLESLGGIVVNGVLGRSLEHSMYSLLRNFEGPLKNLFNANPWPHPWPDLWPLGFLAFGLALDVASGLPLEIPWGTFNLLPREYIEYSRKPP